MAEKHRKKSPVSLAASPVPARSLAVLGLGGVLLLGVNAGAWAQTAPPPEAPPTNLPVPAVPAVPPTPVEPPAGPSATPTLPTNTTVAPTPYQVTGAASDKNKPDTTVPATRDGKKDGTSEPLRPKGTAERLFGPLFKDITITGGMNATMRNDSVAGGSIATETYTQQNVNTLDQRQLGPFRQNMDMTITGKVFNAFNINARLSNSRYGNQFNQIFGIDYKSKGTSFNAGTVNAALPGNNLVTFSRSLEGIIASREFGKVGGMTLKTTGVASLTRAVTRKGSFQGNGTIGPYYMNASSLREGSEVVRLNAQQLQRDKDYRIDYLLGQITFLGSRIINQGDTVDFSYEAQNFNTTPGILTGTRIDIGGKLGTGYGITYLQQKAFQQNYNANGTITEKYPVNADITYPYQINSLIDPTVKIKVSYQNNPLTEGIDYRINPTLRQVFLIRGLPADTSTSVNLQSLQIEYKPVRQSSATGDRSIMGLDTVQRLGKNGTVNMQFGQSQGDTSTQNGQALTIGTSWHSDSSRKTGAWTATAGLKNVGLGFAPIESVASAFLQAERGADLGFTYAPNQMLDFSTTLKQSQVANVYTTVESATTGVADKPVWVGNQNFTSAINFRPKGDLPIMSLTHSQTGQSSGQASGSRSSYASDAFNASWSKGIVGLTGALTRSATRGQSPFSTYFSNGVTGNAVATGVVGAATNGTFGQTINDTSSTSSRLQASLNPTLGRGMTLGMTGEIGFSNTKNGVVTNGTQSTGGLARARNTGFGFNFAPMQNLTLASTWNESTNGQSTAGFFNTGATTTNGVPASQLGSILTGQKTRSTTYSLQYTPSPRLSFGFTGSRALSLIPGSDNSQNVASNWNLSGTPLAKMQLSLNITDQKVNYVGGQGNSTNKSTSLTGLVGPFGRFSLTTQFTRMNYSSATYNSFGSSGGTVAGVGNGTATNLRSAFIGRGRAGETTDTTSLLGTTAGYTTGYLQDGVNNAWSFRTDYSIGGNKSLFAQYRSVYQGTPTATSVGTDTTVDPTYHSAVNYSQGVGTVGLELRLTEVVGFSFCLNVLQQNDRDDSRYSYRARTFNMDLSARF